MPGERPHTGRTIDSNEKAMIAARAALDKQAEDVLVMDLRSLASITDFFVVCTAGSTRQIDALKEHLETVLTERGCPVWHTEGLSASAAPGHTANHKLQWVLMDCGDIVVHLMDQPTRSFYRLEDLWADVPHTPIAST